MANPHEELLWKLAESDEIEIETRREPKSPLHRTTIWVVSVAQQLAAVEPGGMTEVVSTEACEGHAKVGVRVAGVGGPAVLERNDGVFPVTPVQGGHRANNRVRVLVE